MNAEREYWRTTCNLRLCLFHSELMKFTLRPVNPRLKEINWNAIAEYATVDTSMNYTISDKGVGNLLLLIEMQSNSLKQYHSVQMNEVDIKKS